MLAGYRQFLVVCAQAAVLDLSSDNANLLSFQISNTRMGAADADPGLNAGASIAFFFAAHQYSIHPNQQKLVKFGRG